MPISLVSRAGTRLSSARRASAGPALSLLAAVVAFAAVATPLAAQRARGTRSTGTRSTGTRSTSRATSRPAARPTSPAAASRPESTYLGVQVDTLAEPNPATFVPRYPPALRARGVPGTVIVQFVVDTSGRVDMRTFKVLSSSDTAFTTAVRTAVARTDFLPALLDGRKVRQLYEQPFTFAVDEVARPATRDTSAARTVPSAAGSPP